MTDDDVMEAAQKEAELAEAGVRKEYEAWRRSSLVPMEEVSPRAASTLTELLDIAFLFGQRTILESELRKAHYLHKLQKRLIRRGGLPDAIDEERSGKQPY